MSFYKREGEELLTAPNFVRAPGYDLFAEQKDTYTYPVDGWYWFDTLDAAMASMQSAVATISPLQAKIAISRSGLLAMVEGLIAASDEETRLAWANATEFRRDSSLLLGMAAAMGLTEAELDALFALAASIKV